MRIPEAAAAVAAVWMSVPVRAAGAAKSRTLPLFARSRRLGLWFWGVKLRVSTQQLLEVAAPRGSYYPAGLLIGESGCSGSRLAWSTEAWSHIVLESVWRAVLTEESWLCWLERCFVCWSTFTSRSPPKMFHFFFFQDMSNRRLSAVLTGIDSSPVKSFRFLLWAIESSSCWIPNLAAKTFGKNICQSNWHFSPTAVVRVVKSNYCSRWFAPGWKTHRYWFYRQIKSILMRDFIHSLYLDGILKLHVVRICPVKCSDAPPERLLLFSPLGII